ncbi:hypothetical protein ACQCVN_04650 [Rossellomorea aquimaris]
MHLEQIAYEQWVLRIMEEQKMSKMSRKEVLDIKNAPGKIPGAKTISTCAL